MATNPHSKTSLVVRGLLATGLTPLIIGISFLAVQIYIFHQYDNKFGPWGSFKIGFIILATISVALGIGFLFTAIPLVICKIITLTRHMICVSTVALTISVLALVSGFTRKISTVINYPGAEKILAMAIIFHAVTFAIVALIFYAMKQNDQTKCCT